jgi:hypothetical protein
LSTFNIPDKPLNNPIWVVRRKPTTPRRETDRLLLEERRILQEHATRCGCCLMVKPHAEQFHDLAPEALRVRLDTLLRFVLSMPPSRLRIAVNPRLRSPECSTIIGDWFCAEAVTYQPGEGIVNTIFTRHAPTVMAKAAEFDREFEDVVAEQGGLLPARRQAIRVIRRRMLSLKMTPVMEA